MKQIKFLFCVITLCLFSISTLAYAEGKLAYVDFEKVMGRYSKTKEYDKILENKQKALEKEREGKVGKLKGLQEKLSLLSEEERAARRSELEDKISELREFDRNATQDLRKQRDEKLQEIVQDIKQVIETYAKGEEITFVFFKRALIYQKDNLDITDKILKILNKN